MCVILVCEEKYPSMDMVAAAYAANPNGAGLAWREKRKRKGSDKEEDGVRWKKGLDLETTQELIPTLPLPFIAHFRIPSAGTDALDLCHPFPISENGFNALSGWMPKGRLLFHNGTWSGWKSTMLESVVSTGRKLPSGRWSDTRAMAWLTAYFGDGILDFIDEKVIIFPHEGDIEVFGSGWALHEDILVSNKFFVHRQTTTQNYWDKKKKEEEEARKAGHTRILETEGARIFKYEDGVRVEVKNGKRVDGATGGALHEHSFCGAGDPTEEQVHQQEQVQEGDSAKEADLSEDRQGVHEVSTGKETNGASSRALMRQVDPEDLSTWLWAAGINNPKHRPFTLKEIKNARNVLPGGGPH